MYFVPLQPQICATKGGVALPKNQTGQACVDCPAGTTLGPNGQCITCTTRGYYYNGYACVQVQKGSAIVRTSNFFFDNTTSQWPAGWSTSCSGSCGSSGWRLRGSYIDSGFHNFDTDTDVDSFVSLQTEV
jgi:hypothetical protein